MKGRQSTRVTRARATREVGARPGRIFPVFLSFGILGFLLLLVARAWGSEVATDGLAVAVMKGEGSDGAAVGPLQEADSILLSVLWSQIDTFSTYDVELLRGSSPDETPENLVASRSGVGDLDASFFQVRPPPSGWACFLAQVKVAGSFDTGLPAPDDVGPAPWGLSPVLCVRTPNPPPEPPDVQIDTATVVGAAGELLGTIYATLPVSYGAGSWRILPWGYPTPHVYTLAEIGHRREFCTYASVCQCPQSGNDWCPCTIDTWGPLVRFDLADAGGRLKLEKPADYIPDFGGPGPYTFYSPYVYGTCREVERIA